MAPKVTVLMTVYNDQKYVGLAIQSILDQTFEDYEFIIINDGSTDGTQNILTYYATLDQRIKVYNQPNSGMSVALNRGLREARGIYIARMDSDDISYPFRLQIEYDFLNNHPECGLVGGGVEIIDTNGRVIGERNIRTRNAKKILKHRCIFQHSEVMFRKDVVIALGGYHERFKNALDYDLWLRISTVKEIVKIDKILGKWRLNPGGLTLSHSPEQESERRIIKKYSRNINREKISEYQTYIPRPKAQQVNKLSEDLYFYWVALAQLQSLHTKEAFVTAKKIKDKKYIKRKIILLFASNLPIVLLRILVKTRNIYLNHR